MEEEMYKQLIPLYIPVALKVFTYIKIKAYIEALDPNVLSKNMIEKVSVIYAKKPLEITDKDIELINALYKINVEDKKNADR